MYWLEKFILVSSWIIGFISLIFIPKNIRQQASFIFLFSQLPSWLFGLLAVEFGLLEYPVREFAKANGTSFTFEFLVLPIICVFFNIYYPEKRSFYKKIIYYITVLGPITLAEYFIEKYTLLLNYIHWEWYFTFITMVLFVYFIRAVYKWFFKLGRPFLL